MAWQAEDYTEADGNKLVTLLEKVETQIRLQFLVQNRAKAEWKEAQQLQSFFRALKQLSMQQHKNELVYKGFDVEKSTLLTDTLDTFLDASLIQEIYDQIQERNPKLALFLNRSANKIYKNRGEQLEHDIARVIEAIAVKAIKDYKPQTLDAHVRGNITATNLRGMADNLSKELLEHFRRATKSNTRKARAMGKTYMKVDVSGEQLTITSSIEVDPRYIKIMTLLSKARFTAKNYGSRSYQDLGDGKKGWGQNTRTEIHFGDTGTVRVLNAIIGFLEQGNNGHNLKLSRTEKEKLMYGLATVLEGRTSDDTVIATANRVWAKMRTVYEITGAGQIYQGNLYSANLLIYNDPTGDDFYVIPASALIAEMFEKALPKLGAGVSISKSTIHKQF